MRLIDELKKYKPLHWIYNLYHRSGLAHNQKAYQDYGLRKTVFDSISSKDFPDKTSRAWLDTGDSAKLVPDAPGIDAFPGKIQQQLIQWSAQGYLLWDQFITREKADHINQEVEELIAREKLQFTHDNKLPFLMKKSAVIRDLANDPRMLHVLKFILGKEVIPFQTLNFIRGSGQRTHSDSIHMTTYPLGYLIAVWIALEDIDTKAGPLFYYPGSHRLPYLLNDDFGNISSAWKLGSRDYRDYEDIIEGLVQDNQMEKRHFLPRKGDMLVWHANLLHGGESIQDHTLTRKSMVIHYYAKDVIKYHEITERPAIF